MQKPIVPKKLGSPPSDSVFIGGIPYKTTKEEIVNHFSGFGTIVKVTFPTVTAPVYRNKGFCFLTFASVADAANAVNSGPAHVIRARKVW
jgi:RNA recognition motif-containing protein